MSIRPTLSREILFEKGQEFYLEHLSIDCVIFGFHDNQLKVLLLEWRDTRRWCLPGGFIFKDEPMEDAANRIANSRTGLNNLQLQQFFAFGDPARGRKPHGIEIPKNLKGSSWLQDRFITIGYWTLVEFSKAVPSPDELSSDCRWWGMDEVPQLILDHNAILEKALQSLRQNLNDYPIGRELLPIKFTMPELQRLYETILGKKLDRRNFQKKMIAMDIMERLPERKEGVAHKAPFLYRFHPKKYQKARKTGWRFGLL